MKRCVLSLLLGLVAFFSYGQKIIEAEYFFNTDPGLGQGTSIVIPVADSIVGIDASLAVGELPVGFNKFYFRAKDDDNRWSHTTARIFHKMKSQITDKQITKIEYFINDDPGLGNGTNLDFSQTENEVIVSQTIDITGLSDGFNYLYVRSQSNDGTWSLTSKRIFFIYSSKETSSIQKVEYFIDDDPGLGSGTDLSFTQNGSDVVIDHSIDIAGLDKGFHFVYVRALNTGGAWSMVSKRAFFVKDRDQKDLPDIVSLEYYIANEDTVTQLYTFDNFQPALTLDTVDLVWLKDSLKLTINEHYNLYVRAVDENGNRSPFTSDKFVFYDSIPQGDIPMDAWVPFSVENGKPYEGNVYAGEVENLFAFVKKADRLGYSATWGGSFKVKKDDEDLSNLSGSSDFDMQLTEPKGGFYDFEITTNKQQGTGYIMFTEYPDKLELNSWEKGEILRPYGYDWKYFDVENNTDTLFIKTEGYGLWSTIEVFYEDINQKDDYWYFSNMGKGYAIGGYILDPQKGRYYFRYKDSAVLYDNEEDDKSTQRRDYLVFVGGVIETNQEKISDTIVIKNLSSYVIGTGIVSVDYVGTGFSSSDTVILKSNNARFLAYTTVHSSNRATATFNVPDDYEGLYQFLIINSDGDSILADSLVSVEETKENPIKINVLSRSKIRVGRWHNIEFQFSNHSNTTKLMIPVQIEIPINSEVVCDEILGMPTYAFQDTIIDPKLIRIDEVYNGRHYVPLIIPAIDPEETFKIRMKVKVIDETDFMFSCTVGGQWLILPKDLEAFLRTKSTLSDDCTDNCSDELVYATIDAFSSIMGIGEVYNCAGGIFSLIYGQSYNFATKYIRDEELIEGETWGGKVFSTRQYLVPILGTITECLLAAGKQIPIVKAVNGITKVVGVADHMWGTAKCIYSCTHDDSLEERIDETLSPVSSATPEDKYGLIGHPKMSDLGEMEHFIDTSQVFEYRIDYWNKEDASAPAAIVYIRDTLDTDFDISTLNFTEIGFLKWKVKLDGGDYFNVNVDCRPDMPYIVNVEGTVDPESREVYWVHTTLDPETMEMPDDPLSGYLPPIDSTGYQIGWVDFSIEAKEGLPSGTVFENQARVNFDGVGKWGPAPPEGPYKNVFDADKPISAVWDLPTVSANDTITINWSGTDVGSGVRRYKVYVAENENNYSVWEQNTSETTGLFVGQHGITYKFYSIAEDFVGNVENSKTDFEAVTTFDLITGINEDILTDDNSDLIHVYPNPSKCCYTIKIVQEVTTEVLFVIYDLEGQLIYSKSYGKNQVFDIDLSSYAKGLYNMKIMFDDYVVNKKIVLQ